jgi:hypothetical protein
MGVGDGSDPFLHLPVGTQQRDGSGKDPTVLPVQASHPILVQAQARVREMFLPDRDHVAAIIGMHGIEPAVAEVRVWPLAAECFPTPAFGDGAVRCRAPDHDGAGLRQRSIAALARDQGGFSALCIVDVCACAEPTLDSALFVANR